MSEMQELARRAAASKTVADEIRKIGDAAKSELLGLMAEGGSERVRVSAEDGTNFGTVTMTAGRASARVCDPQALVEWVARRHPEYVVQAVAEGFLDRLLAHAARVGDPVDEQGELVPGVEVVTGQPYLTVRPTPAARERASRLLDSALPALGYPSSPVA